MNKKIRTVIVDDSAIARGIFEKALKGDGDFEIMESHKIGILGMHTTEALMRFDDMNNISTKGIGKPSNYKN